MPVFLRLLILAVAVVGVMANRISVYDVSDSVDDPLLYGSRYTLGPSQIMFDPDLSVELVSYNQDTDSLSPLPVVNQTMVVDVLIFRQWVDCPTGSYSNCVPYLLMIHGIGTFSYQDGIKRRPRTNSVCCTRVLAKKGYCKDVNRPILPNTFHGEHLQWEIPVGESKVPRDQVTNSSLAIEESGRYLVAIVSCSVDSYDHSADGAGLIVDGKFDIVSSYGYLSPYIFGSWAMFLILVVAYLVSLVMYVKNGFAQGRSMRRSEKWIFAILVLGLCEASLDSIILGKWNSSDQGSTTLSILRDIFSIVKMTLSLFLGILLAQASGLPCPVDGPSPLQERAAKSRIALYIAVGIYCANMIVSEICVALAFSHNYAPESSVFNGVQYFSMLFPGIIAILMMIWMTVATSRTILYLRSIEADVAHLRRYIRLRYIYLVTSTAMLAVTVSGFTVYDEPFLASDMTLESEYFQGQLYVEALRDTIFAFAVIGVSYLWRPQANEVEYSALTNLLLNNDPSSMDNDLTLVEHRTVPDSATGLPNDGEGPSDDAVDRRIV